MLTNQHELNREWLVLAPAWIKEATEGANPTRNGLLDAPMLEACGNVANQRILDCGCDEGRFCRLLAARGAAYILGLDLCSLMIEAAEAMKSSCDEYRVADVQKLSFLDSGTFDLAVSYLNQCDLPDFHANNREVFRVLKHGDRFIVANLHPMKSAVGGWHRLTMERSFTSFSTDTSRKVSAVEHARFLIYELPSAVIDVSAWLS